MTHWEPTTPPFGEWPPNCYGEDPPPYDPTATLYLWEHWRTDIPEPAPETPEPVPVSELVCGVFMIGLIAYLMFFSGTADGSKGTQEQWADAYDGHRMAGRR
ncbi:hypothetical protein RUESEDTHA_00855 [Ruegeria sp. THAF57]|uniref:hypothetical protein n=1 Tax=Ruegeria sp. THAF57 TaxID=2744555 RepID=UPI0015DF5498|nr:hypothetical protein [Ruegeria sp. THAF57]CAD0183978.1 hypothetical protein RUESEDTHA_00855 [Ruegeria sp. THAF57]